MPPSSRPIIAAVLAALAAAAVYAGSLKAGFVYDDIPIVAENPLVQAPSRWRDFLASPYWSKGEQRPRAGGLYRPLTMASFALNRRAAGPRPRSFHLVNVLLHAADAALLCLLAGALGWGGGAALVCGLAFAVLPIHVEAVAWVVGRSELLAAFFCLAAWLCLYRRSGLLRWGLGCALFLCALLSKESAGAFPAAFVLSELLPEPGRGREVLKERGLRWLALFAVLGLYLEWRWLVLGSALHVGRPYFAGRGALTAALTMGRFFWSGWMRPMASGWGLCADYARPAFPDASADELAAWLALAALAGLGGWSAAAFLRRRSKAAFAALCLLALAAPLSNLLVPMEILGAERLTYLPSAGFCLWLAALWRRGAGRRAAPMAAAALLLLWSVQTVRRCRVWGSESSLWQATALCAPGNPRVLVGAGRQLDLEGRHREARELYRRALESDPGLAQAAYDTAKSFLDEGDLPAAQRAIESMLQRWPQAGPEAWCLQGVIAEARRDYRGADAAYRRAVELDGRYALARRNLGLLFFRTGRGVEGLAELRTYLELDPPEDEAYEVRAWLSRPR